jgi:hypothetical protein
MKDRAYTVVLVDGLSIVFRMTRLVVLVTMCSTLVRMGMMMPMIRRSGAMSVVRVVVDVVRERKCIEAAEPEKGRRARGRAPPCSRAQPERSPDHMPHSRILATLPHQARRVQTICLRDGIESFRTLQKGSRRRY